jgi:hypothetical protein
MTKLYYKWRYFFYNQGAWRYTIDYLFREQRPDYEVKIDTYELTNPKNFVVVEFDETKYKIENIRYDFDTFYKSLFNLAELEREQALDFLRKNSIMKEIEEGKFLISEGWEFMWETKEPTYLII